MERISDGPPRGMRQSTLSRWRMNSTAASRDVSSTRTRASSGRPTLASASRSTPAMATFERIAPDEPRRNAALPDLRHRAKASLVTLGRFS
jgi:hypothetical protein